MKLLIVESPTKAKTIRKFLKGYYVLATYGHLLDLPPNSFGIYLKNNQIEAKYVPIKGKKKIIERIKNLSSKAEEIILATDPDREGEMIAYEIKMILPEKEHSKIKRIFVHEIIPTAFYQALKNLTQIKESLVRAQKGRRYLDRIFGYTLSPILWKEKIGSSAGRVQSAALRLIIEREEEIRNFKKEKYFNVYALLENFPLKLVLVDKNLKILNLKKEELESLKKEILKIKNLTLEKILEEKKKIYPPLPLDTENLQRMAYQFLKFPPKKTMFIAQKLFEAGYITYHRTDSHSINKNFSLKIKEFIEKNYGKNYFSLPRSKKEKISFEAHEAIRPTSLEKPNLTKDFLKLWQLILMVTIASHFKPLEYLESKYLFKSQTEHGRHTDDTRTGFRQNTNYTQTMQGQNGQNNMSEQSVSSPNKSVILFLAINKELIFDGFAKIFPVKEKFSKRPEVKEKENFNILEFQFKEVETKPPSRFNEASLIKKMKELGIGRPSTYVPIIEILKKREYIIKEKNFLKPTEKGEAVYKFLKGRYPELVDLKFTALMEEKLDDIALDKLDYQKFVIDFWKKLKELSS
ncbi:DNA topoisomerase 1 [bacterium HR35]|nr:DNA topoisomerase 1 [bacterium HR35]